MNEKNIWCVFFSGALTSTKESLENEGDLIEFQTENFKSVSNLINVYFFIYLGAKDKSM